MDQVSMLARLIESLAASISENPSSSRTPDRVNQIRKTLHELEQVLRDDR